MRDKSSKSLMEFIMDCIFYGVIAMVWYKKYLFCSLGDFGYTKSGMLLWAILAVSILLGTLVLFREYRTSWTVAVSVILPYGIYTVLTYTGIMGAKIERILGVFICLAFGYTILVMTKKVRNPRKKKQILRKRFHRCLVRISSILAVGMAVIMLLLFLQGIFKGTVFTGKNANINTLQEETISNHIDTVLLLQPAEWKKLNTKEKLNVMQVIANIEAHYLGLPDALSVDVADLEESTLAVYADKTHSIYINGKHLENGLVNEVLNSCCHEVYHSYQCRLVDAYKNADAETKNLRIYKEAVSYLEEFDNYTNGNKDFEEYYLQKCESDAREYAETAVADYYFRISQYLGIDSFEE